MKKSVYIIAYCCFSLLDVNGNELTTEAKNAGGGEECCVIS